MEADTDTEQMSQNGANEMAKCGKTYIEIFTIVLSGSDRGVKDIFTKRMFRDMIM